MLLAPDATLVPARRHAGRVQPPVTTVDGAASRLLAEAADEAARLELLDSYAILDTPPEQGFDDVVLLASRLCETPVALVSLVASDRQWFKAKVGFPSCETPLSQSVCALALRQPDTFIIPDLSLDERTRDNTLVTEPPHIRFYAGALLQAQDGTAIGTLCVIDTKPRPHGLTAMQRSNLEALARQTMAQLELRRLVQQQAGMMRAQLAAERVAARSSDEARRLAALVEQSTDFIGMIDPDGGVMFVNLAGRRLAGMAAAGMAAPEQPPAARFADYFMPDEQARIAQTVLPAVRRQGGWQGELTLRDRATGAPVPVLCNIFPLRGADGGAAGYGTVMRDLREARTRELRRAALLELGDRLRDVDDADTMATISAEVVGRALDASAAGYATIAGHGFTHAPEPGAAPDDARGDRVLVAHDWVAPGVGSIAGMHRLRDYGAHVTDLRRGAAVVIGDVRRDPRTAAASGRLEALSARALINLPIIEHGQLVAIFFVISAQPRHWTEDQVGFVRNVAERTRLAIERCRAESSLRALAASLEAQVAMRKQERDRVWRSTNDLMATAGLDGYLRTVNPAWSRMLGWSETELLARPLADLVDPADHAALAAAMARLAAGEEVTDCVDHLLRQDGGRRTVMWNAVPDGPLFYIVGRDITAQRQAEEQLRQAQKMEAVGQLTGGMAHDFNNLLTGIAGSLELLQTRIGQGRTQGLERYVAAAQDAARRAAGLTHRLLAFSRRQTLDPRPTDLNRLVGGMQDLIGRTVGPEIALRPALADGLWTTLVDPGQLESALLNLCINARDAMPGGGVLTIQTANAALDAAAAARCGVETRDMEPGGVAPGDYVVLRVRDDGTGMPPEVIARAFDPFFTTKPIGRGTGLGLSMVYGFARQSGGQVSIASDLGQGTTVALYLPRHLGAPEAPSVAVARGAPQADRPATVLVVDDEPTVRRLVAEVLEELDYRVLAAEDGASGLAVLQSTPRVDLLVTDVGLPGGMNGRQLADTGRALRPGMKVLFITGYAEQAVVSSGNLTPDVQILPKPFELATLAARIGDLLSAR